MSSGKQAGVLWLLVAALNAAIAWLSWTTGADSTGDTRTMLSYLAIGSAFAALIALYSGIRLIARPSRGALFGAMVWGAINLALIVWGVISGAGAVALFGGVLIALATAAAWQGWRTAEPA